MLEYLDLASARVARHGDRFRAFAAQVRAPIEAAIEHALSCGERNAVCLGDDVSAMTSAVRDLTQGGGKRLRPTLLIAGYAAAARVGDPPPSAFEAAAAIELLQSYLLIHDDWMDGDKLRRGRPTVHVMLTERFGDPVRGNASAVLAGDYACALAYQTMAGCGAPPELALRAVRELLAIEHEVIFGQQLDVAARSPDPELVYALKTASYTVRGPVVLGGLLAGAFPEALDALDAYGRALGVAFQLRDDLLAIHGRECVTQKTAQSDIRRGKNTYTLLLARRNASPRDLLRLDAICGKGEASDEEVAVVVQILHDTGAIHATERRITDLTDQALAGLAEGRSSGLSVEDLGSAAFALTQRKS